MDAAEKFKHGLFILGLTATQLSRYAGIEPSRVSRGLTGELPFDIEEHHRIINTLAAMAKVQEQNPLPIKWSELGVCRPAVDEVKKQMFETNDPMLPSCFLIRLNASSFLLRVAGSNVIGTPGQTSAVAFDDQAVVDDCIARLKVLGTNAKVETLGSLRRKSTMCRNLADIGLVDAVEVKQ